MWDDERGQAIQIGAVLLFAALIIVFSTYQAFIVPNQNREVEFNHNQRVQEQLQELRNGIVSVPESGTGRSVSVQLGTRYPSRLVALNPGPATGSLRTIGTGESKVNISVINVSAAGETEDFWNGDTRNYSSGSLVYTQNYNEYQQAPRTLYDNTVLVNQNRNRNLTVTDQQLIDGRTINLISLNGSLSVSRTRAVTVDLEAVSAPARTVPVTNDDAGENVTIGFPTRLNESNWRNILEDEFDDPDVANDNRYIYNLTVSPISGTEFNRIEIRLEEDTQYNLRLSRVGVGTGVQPATAEYVTTVSGDGSTIEEGSTQQLVVEVRDRFNSPVSGQQVRAAIAGSSEGGLTDVSDTTTETGRAVFEYNAPQNVRGVTQQQNTVNIGIVGNPNASSFNPDTAENVTMSVTVENTNGDGLSSDGVSPNAGQSGISSYTPRDDSLLTSSANGRWQGINRTDQVIFYDGTPILDPGNSREFVRSEFTIRNDTEEFSVDVEAARASDGTYSGSVSIYRFADDNQASLSLTADAAEQFLTASNRYDGVDILNRDSYGVTSNSTFTTYQQTIADMDRSSTEVVFSAQEGRVDTALQGETLFTAIEPDPDTDNDGDEFARVHFENETNTKGWSIEDDDGTYSLPDQRLEGEYYFTKTKSTFTTNHPGIDASRVFEWNIRLANGGEALELRDESDNLRDEVAYDSSQSTSNDWSLSLSENEVGVRSTYTDGVYEDTDSQDDWSVQSESSFFGGGSTGDGPSISSPSASETTSGKSDQISLQASFSDATGDGNSLDSVEINVYDSGGGEMQVEPTSIPLSGDSDSIDTVIENSAASNGKFPADTYTVELIVTDTDSPENSATRSTTVTIS